MTSNFKVTMKHPILDEILTSHKTAIGKQYEGYRNHCLTVYNLIKFAMQLDEEQDTAVAIATAFHDIALWLDDSIDYLAPSIGHARQYCRDTDRGEMAQVIDDMILYHHKIFPKSLDKMDPLVRAFRDADWSAFTFGFIPFDRFSPHRKAIAKALPDEGFHKFLTARTVRHLKEGGIKNPLPMMKW